MRKKERVLTPAEQARKEKYLAVSQALAQDGYEKKELTVGVVAANVAGIFIMLPFILAVVVLFAVLAPETEFVVLPYSTLLLLVAFLVLSMVHEAIHGLVWGLCSPGGFGSIAFGIIWKALTPYCTCGEPLKKWQYILGALMPTLVLGFVLAAVATALSSYWLQWLAVLMIFGGGGDFLIVAKMLFHRSRGREVLCYDHPYECGVVVFEK